MTNSADIESRRQSSKGESIANAREKHDWSFANAFQKSTNFIDRHLELFQVTIILSYNNLIMKNKLN